MRKRISYIFNYLNEISVKNSTLLENKRKMFLLNSSSILFCFMSIIMLIVNYFSDNMLYVKVLAIFLTLNLGVIATQILTESHKPANIIFISNIFLLIIFLIHKGGVENLGIIWILIMPPVLVFILGFKHGLISVLIILFSSIIMLFAPNNIFLDTSYSIGFKFRFLIAFAGTSLFSVFEEFAREKLHKKLDEKNIYLEKTLNEVKELSGLIPICANCKKIRDDEGYWDEVEFYVQKHSKANFTHSICPDCIDLLYPQIKK